MVKRVTSSEEISRVLERIRNHHGKNINNLFSFNVAFSKELDISDKELSTRQQHFRDKMFKEYKQEYPQSIQKELKEFKPVEKIPVKKEKLEFKVIARAKKRIVYARKTFVVINKKRFVRFRDRKGRFVSVRKK